MVSRALALTVPKSGLYATPPPTPGLYGLPVLRRAPKSLELQPLRLEDSMPPAAWGCRSQDRVWLSKPLAQACVARAEPHACEARHLLRRASQSGQWLAPTPRGLARTPDASARGASLPPVCPGPRLDAKHSQSSRSRSALPRLFMLWMERIASRKNLVDVLTPSTCERDLICGCGYGRWGLTEARWPLIQ